MILGVGVDLADVDRWRMKTGESEEDLLSAILTPAEIAICRGKQDPYPHYAARFAVKEAFVKALGTGLREGLAWTQMEVRSEGSRPPGLVLSGPALAAADERGVRTIHVSMSHERGFAVGLVVLEG